MATLQLTETAAYFFDEEAADRPCRFIQKYAKHWEGIWAGEPFTLIDWQRDLVRTLFGWKRKDDGRRRFQQLYLISGKGSGKTPLFSAIGLYCLLGDGEAAPHVISLASSFEQASLTFDGAKKYILNSPDLGRHAVTKQYRIVTRGNGKWTLVSGKPTGRSGHRPSVIVADELHEWSGATGQSFNLLSANLMKRQQPLTLVATNAGTSRQSFGWLFHERALAVLQGKSADETLLPYVFEADESLDWTSEAAAAAANPSLNQITSFDALQPQLTRARQDDSAESEYRRLYLSQWCQDKGDKWLDLSLWDACTANPEIPKDAALYVGLDLSMGDDLCAAAYVWVTPSRFYIRSHFWLPKATAARYELRNAVPYTRWAAEGAITLLEETTISSAVKQRIAGHIIETHKAQKVRAVCYDRYKADDCIAALEGAGITCVAVPQGYSTTPGCNELERRLKESSIVIEPNPVLRAHAETVEVKTDDRNNFWVVKPNAKGKYAGRRSAKIDGIAALVTALTEARKHGFPNVKAQWRGSATII